jgi:hypothetical protein
MRGAALFLLVLTPARGAVELALPEAPAVSAIRAAFPAPLAALPAFSPPVPALSAPAADVAVPIAAPIAAAAPVFFAAPEEAAAPAEARAMRLVPGAASPAAVAEERDTDELACEARRSWDGGASAAAPSASEALARTLVAGGASPRFVAAVRAHVARSFPPAVLSALLDARYRVEVNTRLRDGRDGLDASLDFLNGYHEHGGPNGNIVLIGEETKTPDGTGWEKSGSWENAVNHELGLALARTLGDSAAALEVSGDSPQSQWYRKAGIGDSPELRAAWRRDYEAMPSELKRDKDPDGLWNPFYYFLTPGKNGWFQDARRLTFAEGLDVLLRGPRSTFNHEDFTRYFPRTLDVMRRMLAARFGWNLPAPSLTEEVRRKTDPALSSAQLAEILVSGGASPAFVANIRAQAASFPPAVLRDLLDGGYRIEANATVRQGRPELDEDDDYTGGFHSQGKATRYIVVAEELKLKDSKHFVKSRVWENALNHEIGHALAYLIGEERARSTADPEQALWYRKKGLSESPAFREAWRLDYLEIPDEFKQPWRDHLENMFFYFVHSDEGGWYQRARQETFAEGFDILRRGPRSSFNYENFTRRFPRALAEIRREVEARYGPMFLAP